MNYYLKEFTLKEGLYNNHVRSIAGDSSGFLWVATWDGMSRFDGNEFRNYFKDPEDPNSLPDIDLRTVCIDRYNNVWLLAKNFLCRYDRQKDHFIKIDNLSTEYKTRSSFFYWIAVDPAGNLWVAGDKGLETCNSKGEFLQYKMLDEKAGPCAPGLIESFIIDKNNVLWVFKDFHLSRFRCDNSSKSYILETQFKYNLANQYSQGFIPQIFQIFYGEGGKRIWITSNFGLYCVDEKIDSVTRNYCKIQAGEFQQGHPEIMWTSFDEGLMIYSPYENCCHKPDINNLSLPEYLYKDNQGIIWIGGMLISGEGAGLRMLVKTSSFFRYYLDNTNEKNNLAVFSIFKDTFGNLWVGTKNYNYITKINPDSSMQKLNVIDTRKFPIAYPRSFYDDKKGNLWIGYYYNFLYKYNYNSDQFSGYLADSTLDDFPFNFMECFQNVTGDGSGALFLTGGVTLCCYDPLKKETLFSDKYSKDGYIYSQYIDRKGNYWIGSKNELKLYSKNSSKPQAFSFKNIKSNIECIVEGDSSELWLALLGEGLCRFDINTKSVRLFTTSEGLSHNTTYHILKDKKGNLWISTNKGISMFNIKTRQFRNFGIDDGLKIVEFNSDAAFQCENGEMFFGGMGGVVSFFPDSLIEEYNYNDLPLLFTDLKVSGVPYYLRNIYELGRVELEPGANNFEISFSFPDHRNADKIYFRYCLKGYNDNWIITDSKHRFVNYASLEPGEYEFMLEATDRNGNWSRKKSIEIFIPAFYYQTTWFWLIIGFVTLLIIALFIYLQIRYIRLTERKKQEHLKLEILRSQLNPHFIDNCLNSVNNLVSMNDELKVNQYLSDFSRLMRLLLNNSNLEYIPFKDEIESVQKYLLLEHTNNSDKFEFEIVMDENIDIEDTEVMPSMTQPYIENAIKHAFPPRIKRKGIIKIEFLNQESHSICCVITDDGIGHNESQKHKQELQKQRKSKGESLVKERLELFNSLNKTNFKIESDNLYNDRIETGTRVKIEIPVKKKVLEGNR